VLGLATTSARRRGLRSDARENRDRILAAAQAFAEHGLSVSLIEIARRAGVGNATLHRNFAKEQLVEELLCDWYAQRRALAARALADPDPWHGLVSGVEDVLGTCNRTREDVTLVLLGVAQTMTTTGQASPELWRRHLAMVLDGMRAEHTQRLPGLPASTEQLNCDLRAWSCHVLRSGDARS
jgi:AcrR family transcriptional regulator